MYLYISRIRMYNTTMIEKQKVKEKPFDGMKIYFSGSIKGAPELDPDFAWKIVQYLGNNGANVLSEHVAARSREEMDEIFVRRAGEHILNIYENDEPWWDIRKMDNRWVDEATHMIALVNAPSLGVGMELERAIHKPERGLNATPILALIHKDVLQSLSYMVRGITQEEVSFRLRTYSSFEDVVREIEEFLLL